MTNALKSASKADELSIMDPHCWQNDASALMKFVYSEVHASFVEKPHTASLLGVGAKILYQAFREDLGVPFHLGFAEHSTAESSTLNDRDKKTIGSWITIIYEAVRSARLHGPIIATLKTRLLRH